MMDEVRFSNFSEKGEARETVRIEDFIKLFVNHRPVYGIGKNDIEQAFKDLVGEEGNLQITKDELYQVLTQEGESMTKEEIAEAFGYLVGEKVFHKAIKGNVISAEEFASDILGFEECEDDEEEVAAAGAEATQGSNLDPLKKIAEAIPEEEH